MERLDQATTELIEQEVRGHFPEGVVDSVAVLQYGDDPAVEPGQVNRRPGVGKKGVNIPALRTQDRQVRQHAAATPRR